MSSRFRNALTLAIVCALAMGAASTGVASRTLRVCADPNNLPFSNDREEGFENRIASMVAADLRAQLEYVWWAQRRGFLRSTLNADRCDLVIGVPRDWHALATTRPYYRSTYVFVTRRGALAPSSFDDPILRRVVVGVHLIGDDGSNSPPAHALAARGIVANVRGYTVYGDYRRPNPPAALIQAVAAHELDVAVAWGPLAGYFAQLTGEPLMVRPVAPQNDSPSLPFAFDVSMGVRRGDTRLLDALNGFIARRRDQLDRLLREFHVPRVDDGAAGG